MNRYALIMAGGNGERLFPLSTKDRPKQFLNLYGQENMINETIKRIEKIIPVENIFVIINKTQKDMAYKYLDRRVNNSHILCEPKALNTAPAIAYASRYIVQNYGEGTISVFSSDHFIDDEDVFISTINSAIEHAENTDSLITIGIKPSRPETQYGYISYEVSGDDKFHKVKRFVEKPNFEKAIEYVNMGYLWNSGMFVWNSSSIENAIKEYLPNMYATINDLSMKGKSFEDVSGLAEAYDNTESISIDFGIMEKASNVEVIEGAFDWADIGNLENLMNLYEEKKINNDKINNVVGIDSNNIKTFSNNKNKLFATIDLDDIYIVDTDNICLVAKHDSIGKIKQVVKEVNKKSE